MLYSLGLAPGFMYIMCISLRIIVNGVIGGSPFRIIKILGLSLKEVTANFREAKANWDNTQETC